MAWTLLPSASDDPDGSAGMYDDARAIREAIEATAEVAENIDRLIYLSAFQFDIGDSLANQSGDN